MPPVAFSSLCCARAYQKMRRVRRVSTTYGRAREWVRSASAAEVAARESEFFPGISPELLASTIARYQELGTWDGGIEIPRDLYEQALNVFQSAGGITWRHCYEEVVAAPPA